MEVCLIPPEFSDLRVGDIVVFQGPEEWPVYSVDKDWLSVRMPSGNTFKHYSAESYEKAVAAGHIMWIIRDDEPFACHHDFIDYVGFTHRYRYCAKCDEKAEWV